MAFERDHPSPTVSLGIICKNSGAVFRRTLAALKAQVAPWPFEIVVLDRGSQEGTDRFAAEQGARVISFTGKLGWGPLRDMLFEACRGQYIVTLSADVTPCTTDWLVKLVGPLMDGTADATIGENCPPPGEYVFYWDYHASWMRSQAVQFDAAYGRIALTCSNMAISRALWEQFRFGDCEMIEDRNLQKRLYEAGKRMVQVKDALAYHGHSYTWKQLHDRLASWAYGWKVLGMPYTTGRLLRDLMQPSRYWLPIKAMMDRRLRSWQELLYPVVMCFSQYVGSRKRRWS